MRIKMTAMMIFARLCWGDILDSLYWQKRIQKFSPPAQKMVYKEVLLNRFIWN